MVRWKSGPFPASPDFDFSAITSWGIVAALWFDGARMPAIFYVDDNGDDLFYADYVRKKQKIEVTLRCFERAEQVLEALEMLHAKGEELPDVLIADLYMPLDSGLALITGLRADPRFSTIRLGVCTGSDADEDRRRALAAGADFYVEKPIDLSAVLAQLV